MNSNHCTYVLLGEGVDELGKDLVGDDGLSEFVRVVGETAQGKSSRLLDRGHVVKKEGSQKSHNTCEKKRSKSVSFIFDIQKMRNCCRCAILTGALKSLDVLWALSQLSDGLDESDTGLLVGLEGGEHSTGHSVKEVLKLF